MQYYKPMNALNQLMKGFSIFPRTCLKIALFDCFALLQLS